MQSDSDVAQRLGALIQLPLGQRGAEFLGMSAARAAAVEIMYKARGEWMGGQRRMVRRGRVHRAQR